MKKNFLIHEKKYYLSVIIAMLVIFSTQIMAQTDTVQTNVPALKDVYTNDFYIGCLLSYRHIGLPDDPYVPGQSAVVEANGGYLIQFHMNSMSPGKNMKPVYTVDISASAAAYTAASAEDKDSVDTHPRVRFNGDLIAQLNWAWRQEFTFRGHTLVWHNQTPAELFRSGYTSGGTRLSKENLNDQYTFKTDQACSLWDADNQCKPAFYAVVDVGNYYNSLDSLTAYADTLHESDYTAESWSVFAATLTSAHTAMDQNYSNSVSAADALGTAKDNLEAAIDGLVKIADDVAIHQGNQIEDFALGQNYPNPFNPLTQIRYSVPQSGYVSLKVFNLLGQEVAALVDQEVSAGTHSVTWDARTVSSGVYFYKISAGTYLQTNKMIVLK